MIWFIRTFCTRFTWRTNWFRRRFEKKHSEKQSDKCNHESMMQNSISFIHTNRNRNAKLCSTVVRKKRIFRDVSIVINIWSSLTITTRMMWINCKQKNRLQFYSHILSYLTNQINRHVQRKQSDFFSFKINVEQISFWFRLIVT